LCQPCPANTFSAGERAQDMARATPLVRKATASIGGEVISVGTCFEAGSFLAPSVDTHCLGPRQGLAFSQETNLLYIADEGIHQIKAVLVSPEGCQQERAVVVAGQTAGSENGVGTSARFNTPSDLDISPDGSALYVADTGNHLARVVSSAFEPCPALTIL